MLQISANTIYESTFEPQHNFGAMAITPDGRIFRYCRHRTPTSQTSDTFGPGRLIRIGDYHSDHKRRTFVNNYIRGTTEVEISVGSREVLAQQFTGGYLTIEDDAGEGFTYVIKSHDLKGTGAGNVFFRLETGLQVAVTTSTTCGFMSHPYNNVYPFGAQNPILGVSVIDTPETECSWIQTRGIAACLIDNTATVAASDKVTGDGTTTAGSIRTVTAATDIEIGIVPRFGTSPVSDEFYPIFLTID